MSIATGVAADGRLEVLRCDVGDSGIEVLWANFLRGLRDRGPQGAVSRLHRSKFSGAIDEPALQTA